MRALGIVVGLVVLASALPRAVVQQRPDFTGSWKATKDTPATVGLAPSAVFGETFALKHSGQALDLFRPVRGRTEPFLTRHVLDGAEIRTMLPSRTCFGQAGTVVSTAWDGNAMVYTIAGNLAPGSTTPTKVGIKYTFRLETPDTLVIETSMRDSATAAPRAVATVYKKSADPIPAAAAAPPATTAPATINQVDWIAGTWTGTAGTSAPSGSSASMPSAASASRIEERWMPSASGSMLALSRTLRGAVMSEFEFLCIAERDGTLVYTAMPNAATGTDFHLTKIDADSATFENPAHDFPKMIRYTRKPDGTMEATISGAANQRAVTFVFKKQ